ncbi:DUSAM domain-containing protein [Pyxidicoccus parkwayensis]|uniref:DUSAM domain-containing protein n=1 Tax=Pyxidicoccus parkwayensis TaxID=2813578 RepID=A0ABX7NQJ5_9BACT|nr:DUSAM domain-containing protein [Pyxidicoccus parkwaysis]QSQ21131.1 DUSAM domain-containing protein [Pyxidicoccus parkwaysis]
MTDEYNWDAIRALGRRVLEGAVPLELTADVRAILFRTAREVAISDADVAQALMSESGAKDLLRESIRRISDGSRRLTRALSRMYDHQRAGDYDSARQQMRDVLSTEVVPLYREIAQEQLDDMADDP